MRSIWFVFATILFLASGSVLAREVCKVSKADGHTAEMCFDNPGLFKHWHYTLRVDDELIFVLVEDYAENFKLTHTVPAGPAVELPLSAQGMKEVTISGGCVNKLTSDGTVEKTVCNISWGSKQIIKAMEFSPD
jgi:hypothetical protein